MHCPIFSKTAVKPIFNFDCLVATPPKPGSDVPSKRAISSTPDASVIPPAATQWHETSTPKASGSSVTSSPSQSLEASGRDDLNSTWGSLGTSTWGSFLTSPPLKDGDNLSRGGGTPVTVKQNMASRKGRVAGAGRKSGPSSSGSESEGSSEGHLPRPHPLVSQGKVLAVDALGKASPAGESSGRTGHAPRGTLVKEDHLDETSVVPYKAHAEVPAHVSEGASTGGGGGGGVSGASAGGGGGEGASTGGGGGGGEGASTGGGGGGGEGASTGGGGGGGERVSTGGGATGGGGGGGEGASTGGGGGGASTGGGGGGGSSVGGGGGASTGGGGGAEGTEGGRMKTADLEESFLHRIDSRSHVDKKMGSAQALTKENSHVSIQDSDLTLSHVPAKQDPPPKPHPPLKQGLQTKQDLPCTQQARPPGHSTLPTQDVPSKHQNIPPNQDPLSKQPDIPPNRDPLSKQPDIPPDRDPLSKQTDILPDRDPLSKQPDILPDWDPPHRQGLPRHLVHTSALKKVSLNISTVSSGTEHVDSSYTTAPLVVGGDGTTPSDQSTTDPGRESEEWEESLELNKHDVGGWHSPEDGLGMRTATPTIPGGPSTTWEPIQLRGSDGLTALVHPGDAAARGETPNALYLEHAPTASGGGDAGVVPATGRERGGNMMVSTPFADATPGSKDQLVGVALSSEDVPQAVTYPVPLPPVVIGEGSSDRMGEPLAECSDEAAAQSRQLFVLPPAYLVGPSPVGTEVPEASGGQSAGAASPGAKDDRSLTGVLTVPRGPALEGTLPLGGEASQGTFHPCLKGTDGVEDLKKVLDGEEYGGILERWREGGRVKGIMETWVKEFGSMGEGSMEAWVNGVWRHG